MPVPPDRIITDQLEVYLRETKIRQVHCADGSTVPPDLAYVTNFPRLSLPLAGCHTMEVADMGRVKKIKPVRGHAVFVPDHAWNKPDWSERVEVITLLFGVKQIGISLVRQRSTAQLPAAALKASIHCGYDVPTHSILSALMVLAADRTKGSFTCVLTEALLHACLRLLTKPPEKRLRKSIRTYESLCLYVQENFQGPLSRKTVAQHFGLAPNHVSRVFRNEGLMHFNDYLNLVRVNRAKFMLQNYRIGLKQIASDCGYTDTAYFCRVFKKICKVTPTEYRGERLTGR
jgi:AraC-like DNA-binding protein